MQKKFIALAVAGALAAPFAASADKANVEIYGVAHYSWDFVDEGNGASDNDATGVNRQSRIGFKGSEDLGNGMKAIWQIETDAGDAPFADRPVFAGLTGDWGTFAMGRQEAPYKVSTGKVDLFGDTVGDYNTVIGRNGDGFENRPAQAVAYVTPTINGFHAAIARVATVGGAGTGTADNDVWSLAAVYSNGPLFVGFGYENHDVLLGNDDAWKIGAAYSFGDSRIGGVYEDVDVSGDGDIESYILNFSHKFGANTFKIQYGETDAGAADMDYWAVGIDHAFSKRTKVYAIYADAEAGLRLNSGDNGHGSGNNGAGLGGAYAGDVDGFSFGIVHKF